MLWIRLKTKTISGSEVNILICPFQTRWTNHILCMILLTNSRIFTSQTFTLVIKTHFTYLMEMKKRPHCWREVIISLPLWFTRTRVHCFVDQHETSAQLLYFQHSIVIYFVCISNHITVLISSTFTLIQWLHRSCLYFGFGGLRSKP